MICICFQATWISACKHLRVQEHSFNVLLFSESDAFAFSCKILHACSRCVFCGDSLPKRVRSWNTTCDDGDSLFSFGILVPGHAFIVQVGIDLHKNFESIVYQAMDVSNMCEPPKCIAALHNLPVPVRL